MLFTAASYVSMSRAFPIAGSVYAYAGRAIGESVGFLAGWAMLLDYLLLPTLVYVLCAIGDARRRAGHPARRVGRRVRRPSIPSSTSWASRRQRA